METVIKEVHLRGIPISGGIAIGVSYFFHLSDGLIAEYSIRDDEIDSEIERYTRALKRSRQDVKRLQKQMEIEKAIEATAILETHLQILQDPLLTKNIELEIRRQKKNIEFIFYTYVSEFQRKFQSMSDLYFKERGKDLQDVTRRILGHLCKNQQNTLANVEPNSIVFAKELATSHVAESKIDQIAAFVTEVGGATSHAAIIAKAKGIPYVANIAMGMLEDMPPIQVIIDGRTGDVILNPGEDTLLRYRNLQQEIYAHLQNLYKTNSREAETFDGYQIRLSANIEMINELETLHQFGGNGVGLFRSEYMVLSKQTFPSEEEQFLVYKRLVEKMQGLPIVIRTFDIGGDKFMLNQPQIPEGNPYLGVRAIRFLLKEREIFKSQLRAIIRASAYGDVSVIFPMISGLAELIEAKKLVKEAQQELEKESPQKKYRLRIGCMIEVPSAAIIADLLAKECDFLSIGTNDLVQYSLAADRGNQGVSLLYTPTHPSVIRLMKLVISQANQHGIPVTVCGEVAADPRFTPLLLGLGVHELSVASRYLPIVKNVIRNTSIIEACHLADKVLSLTAPAEIQELLATEYQKNVPQDFFYNF